MVVVVVVGSLLISVFILFVLVVVVVLWCLCCDGLLVDVSRLFWFGFSVCIFILLVLCWVMFRCMVVV